VDRHNTKPAILGAPYDMSPTSIAKSEHLSREFFHNVEDGPEVAVIRLFRELPDGSYLGLGLLRAFQNYYSRTNTFWRERHGVTEE
jgi:hypothetical protein